VHLRLCTRLRWRDSCDATADPTATARALVACACRGGGVGERGERGERGGRIFVSADSDVTLTALARQLPPGRIASFADVSPVEHISKPAALPTPGLLPGGRGGSGGGAGGGGAGGAGGGPGGAKHLVRLGRVRREPASAASLDRATFEWAAFAFSTGPVLALPSSFVASAVCMFRPAAARFDVYSRPTNTTGAPLRCHRPIASEWGAHAHACKVDAEHGATWAHAGMPTPLLSHSKRPAPVSTSRSVHSTATGAWSVVRSKSVRTPTPW